MQKQFTSPTTYFLQEGKVNLRDCLKIAFQTCKQQNVKKIVVFTAVGEGVRLAIEEFCCQPGYEDIRLVAVTFPAGKQFTNASGQLSSLDISAENLLLMQEHRITIVRAHLPFDPIAPFYRQAGVLGQDLTLIGEALNMFCGGMSLCVQAIVLACDCGAVAVGEHVIALTADTAILAQATSTRRMLGELVIREILCKPAILSIGRGEIADRVPVQLKLAETEDQKALGSSEGDVKSPCE